MNKMAQIIPELSNGEFESSIKHGLVLVDFFADWCMPCVMMEPVMEELNNTFKGKIKFVKVNIEDNRPLAHKYDVVSIPNFILFKDGKVIDTFIGSMPEDEFEGKLKEYL